MRHEYPMASGKKSLVAQHTKCAQAIEIVYEPAGSVMPKELTGRFTTFEKAGQAIEQYLNQFKKPATKKES